jgi:hypothetical protein
MAIDIDVLSNAELDEWLGGQVEGAMTLRPAAWADSTPARLAARDEIVRLFSLMKPEITEGLVTDSTTLKHALKLGSAARLYELAMTQAPEPGLFYHLEKRYRTMFEAEVNRVGLLINAEREPDPARRNRRTVSIGRR